MKYLILHGSFGSSDGNWFPQLRDKLEILNQKVILPQFPVEDWDEMSDKGRGRSYRPEHQNLQNWIEFFEKNIYPEIKGEKIVVVAHSLAPLFFLHLLSKFDLDVDSAIFVSPFLFIPANEDLWQIDVVNETFYEQDFDFESLRRKIPQSYVLYSDNDPYVPVDCALEFAEKLDSSTIPVLGGKHLNSEVNLNEFPLVLELCKSRIQLTLYQKYLAHLSEYHPTDLVKKSIETALFLPSTELAKEGVFHFRNLENGGFCTLPVSDIKYWKKENEYMDGARDAASRVPITRVYIFENVGDIDALIVRNMMKKDSGAGISVYYCLESDISGDVEQFDFGIWDDDYVCTVFHDGKNVSFGLDSRKESLDKAKKMKKFILEHSTKFKESI